MIRIHHIVASLVAGILAVAGTPVAHADESVTYEVISSDVDAVNVEYFDLFRRRSFQQVSLPWRINAAVVNPRSDDAELRADWRSSIAAAPVWRPSKWVTVRIYYRRAILCESTLDVGNASCYGSTAFRS
jgi:hypothetical protein